MRRDDVPAERVELELRERALDDRRRRLGRPASGQLALGRERDPGDARAAIAGGLAHEQDACSAVLLEIALEPLPPEIRTFAVAVEVERAADARRSEATDELSNVHAVTMLMRMKRCVAAIVAASFGMWAGTAAAAAPPQGYQSDGSFAGSYAARHVTSVLATAQRVSCYAPEVSVLLGLSPTQGFPDGGGTACPGATTGENVGPFPIQDVANQPLLVKDHSESDLHVDPTNARHLIGVSKWFVNSEGYNHLAGFFESFDGGTTWPAQGHIPGYEGWTDNSDPAGAFDPWGNFYAVVLPYQFDYDALGGHNFLAPRVNPSLARSGLGITVRPHGATTADAWLTAHGGRLDLIATTPFGGQAVFDKQWIAVDTNRRSRHFGRVYVSWAIGGSDASLRIYESHADARADGSHTDWSTPHVAMRQAVGFGDNGSLPRVAPNGTIWMTAASFRGEASAFTASVTSSRDGGLTWAPRRAVVRGQEVGGYRNTTFRSAFGEAFAVGPRKVGRFYPLYLAYESQVSDLTTLFLKASFDGGRRWTRPVQINDNRSAAEALQPNIAVAPGGVVSVAFYDRRLACPAKGTPEAAAAGLTFDPAAPYGRIDFCINTAVQFYRPKLRPIGHNIRLSAHTWDPQLSAARFLCICSPPSFIGDYFGVDSRGGWTYSASVSTSNVDGQNPFFHQQQLVSRVRTP
jgi:hypothetical protein